jgi:hypothetical protein
MAAIPASSVLLAAVAVPANDTEIGAAQITDKRVILGETAYVKNLRATGHIGLGTAPVATATGFVYTETLDAATVIGLNISPTCSKTGGTSGKVVAFSCWAAYTGSATYGTVQGVVLVAQNFSPTGIYAMEAMNLSLHSEAGSVRHASSYATGLDVNGVWHATDGNTVTMRGIYIHSNACGAATVTAYGLHIEDMTPTGSAYLLEIGPATPYLRLVGKADPATGESNLYLKIGSALQKVTVGAADSGGTGYRMMRVPN